MPIKLGLMIMRRRPTALPNIKQQAPTPAPTPAPVPAQQNGLTLRRVMNAPKTGCKSCGG